MQVLTEGCSDWSVEMYDLNLAVDQLKRRVNARFPEVGTETRKSKGSVPAEAIEMLSSAVEAVLIAVAEQCPVRKLRLEDGFCSVGEGFNGLTHGMSASFAYLQAEIQFESVLTPELLPFAQQGTAPVRLLAAMAERNDGFLQVESIQPDTLIFKVKLPIAVAPRWETETPVIEHGASILLVEDEEFVRNVTQEVLEMEGFKVLAASNGQEALAALRESGTTPDLLLTDVVLPGMNGRELASQVADLRPGLRIMFMSGYTDNAVLRNESKETSAAYLQKPFTLDTLIAKVRDILQVDTEALFAQRATAPTAMELR